MLKDVVLEFLKNDKETETNAMSYVTVEMCYNVSVTYPKFKESRLFAHKKPSHHLPMNTNTNISTNRGKSPMSLWVGQNKGKERSPRVSPNQIPIVVKQPYIVLTQQPPETWYKDAQSRRSGFNISFEVWEYPKTERYPRHAHISLLYENGKEVENQGILEIVAMPEVDITLKSTINLRINDISRNHQKQRFRLRITFNEETPEYLKILPVTSRPIKVLSKHLPTRTKRNCPKKKSTLLFHDKKCDSRNEDQGALHQWATAARDLLHRLEWIPVGYATNIDKDKNEYIDKHRPIRQCLICKALQMDESENSHKQDCDLNLILQAPDDESKEGDVDTVDTPLHTDSSTTLYPGAMSPIHRPLVGHGPSQLDFSTISGGVSHFFSHTEFPEILTSVHLSTQFSANISKRHEELDDLSVEQKVACVLCHPYEDYGYPAFNKTNELIGFYEKKMGPSRVIFEFLPLCKYYSKSNIKEIQQQLQLEFQKGNSNVLKIGLGKDCNSLESLRKKHLLLISETNSQVKKKSKT